MKKTVTTVLLMLAVASLALASGTKEATSAKQATAPAAAAEKSWWPFPVHDATSGKPVEIGYVPLQEKATKKYHIVALIPHMKDKTWLACNYGLVAEAKRLGVKLTILEAGGYENLSRQVSQYDDALAMGADAILIGVISEGGMSKKIMEGVDKKIVQISMVNPVYDAPFNARIYCDSITMGRTAGDVAVQHYKDAKEVNTVILPGPQGSGWAEKFSLGFQQAVAEKAKGRFVILAEKFGDSGKSVQLKLVEDAFQSFKKIDLLFGCTPMTEVAINAVNEVGSKGKTGILAAYANEDVIAAIRRGEILGCVVEHVVAQARIAVDMAVRELDNKKSTYGKILQVVPVGITPENVSTVDLSGTFAPDAYTPVYTVD